MDSVKNTVFPVMPISVLASSGTLVLTLHQKGSYGYLFASSAASIRTSPAPPPEILVKYAGCS